MVKSSENVLDFQKSYANSRQPIQRSLHQSGEEKAGKTLHGEEKRKKKEGKHTQEVPPDS